MALFLSCIVSYSGEVSLAESVSTDLDCLGCVETAIFLVVGLPLSDSSPDSGSLALFVRVVVLISKLEWSYDSVGVGYIVIP